MIKIAKEQLDLIPLIYDASIDEEYWAAVLDATAKNIGAKGGALLSISLRQEYVYSCSFLSTVYDRKILDEYEKKYAKYEESHFKRVAESIPLSVIYDHEWMKSPDVFAKRPDVVFLNNNFGIFHRYAVKLNSDMAWFDCLTFQYDDSHNVDRAHECDSLGLLLPHFSQAMKMSRAFRILSARFNAVLGVLDKYLVGVLLVLESMDVVFANNSARQSIESTGQIEIAANGKLTTKVMHDSLLSAVREASLTSRGVGLISTSQILLTKESGNDNLLLEISPVKDTNSELDSSFTGAVITIFDSERCYGIDVNCLKKPYRLTSAEFQVARHYVRGKSYSEISEIRSVSPETVKSQIRSVLQKTNSPNRIALINLIVRISPPVEYA